MRLVVETIGSQASGWKVEIVRREDGLLQVFLLRWIEEVVPDHGRIAEFWADQRTAASITDTLEAARGIGRELLVTVDPAFESSTDGEG
jgi:hypothetical protein